MAASTRALYLPVGLQPGWEQEDEEMNSVDTEWHSIPNSLVILQSLRQSREKWLTSAFPKFSGRARGSKQPEVKPLPHSVKSHTRFEVCIGPHVFSNTALYEIHYLPQPAVGTITSHAYAESQSNRTQVHMAQPSHPSATQPSQSTHPVVTSQPESVNTQARVGEFITPALLEQITQAASTDPALHTLLQLAEKGQLTEEQRSTLKAFVQSLNEKLGLHHGHGEPTPSPTQELSTQAAPAPIIRPFDLVIEFQEKPLDRWLVPRGTVHLANAYGSPMGPRYDVVVTVSLPTQNSSHDSQGHDQPSGAEDPSIPRQTVEMQWKGLQKSGYDALLAWSRTEAALDASSANKLKDSSNTSQRTYLAHRLRDEDLIEQLRQASSPYPMKSIKPANADSNRTRRKAATRKQPAGRNVVSVPSLAKPAAPPTSAVSAVSYPASVTNAYATTSTTPFPPAAPQTYFAPPVTWAPPTTGASPQTEFQASPTPYAASGLQHYANAPVQYHPSPLASQPLPATSSALSSQPYTGVSFAPIVTPATVAPSGSTGAPAPMQSPAAVPTPVAVSTPVAPTTMPSPTTPQNKKSVTPKRQKDRTISSSVAPPPFSCRACYKTDIPLLMGGRICRSCLDGGRLAEAIPELASPPSSGSIGNTSAHR
ncbi:hypothetical protein BDW22DRAFT_1349826 [Trametopsis cervina]|nr:hypothetical protein BDW22DRAFT_1349826 [Trametopsis cervina]